MTKKYKLRLCDWTLAVLMIFILASSIQLETTYSRSIAWVLSGLCVDGLDLRAKSIRNDF